MRRAPLAFVILVAACSGDDTHHRTTPPLAIDDQPLADDAGVAAAATDAAPSGPPVAPLTEDMAVSYFTGGDAAKGAERYAMEDHAGAKAAFTDARAGHDAAADPVGHARLTLMIALCDAELKAWDDAARGFEAARAQLPEIADWIGYQEARALFFAHRGDDALARARAVAADSISGADAELLVGDILRARDDADATAAHYADYLARRPDGIRRSEARYRQAEALEKAKGDRATIVALYHAITVDDPRSSWATKADKRLTALKAPNDMTATELVTRAMVYFDAMQNADAEAAFAKALAAPGITPAETCTAAYHRAQSLFKDRDRAAAAPRFDEAIAACKTAGDTNLEIRAAYQAGRSYAMEKDHQTAIERYRHAQGVDPAHSFTDDALLREAEEWESLGDDEEVERALSSLPDKFPQGDMISEALWRLGWKAWKDDRLDDAVKWWKQQIDLVPIDDRYESEGQAQYWLGRAALAQKDTKAAIAWWEECLRVYPMTYYAAQSLNRIKETRPKRYAALLTEIAADPPGFDPAAPAFEFQPRAEYATPGFARAMILLRLGLGSPAEAELRRLGLAPPPGKDRVTDEDTIEKLWAMAFLYDRAGRYGASHWPTRWHILDYKRQWPVGANRARWQVAFPKGYWDLLSAAAAKHDYPVAMQIAIVREESAFDPLLESYANAIGLTQMIYVTAERFAKGTDVTVTKKNFSEVMRDPVANVTVGSNFLGFLFRKWDDHAVLVPPSYNAGEGAVTKWLRLRGTWPADEFLEAIPGDQARNYSKRVLGSYFAYTWLYQQEVPTLSNEIPAKLLPKN